MSRAIRYSLTAIIAASLGVFVVPATVKAQAWNPFAKKKPATQPVNAKQNQFSLDHILTIPGLPQPGNRPLNQPSLKKRFQQSTQQMWADTKRVVTPPMLQTGNAGSGGIWPFSNASAKSPGFSLPNVFKPKETDEQNRPANVSQWLSQPRPETR